MNGARNNTQICRETRGKVPGGERGRRAASVHTAGRAESLQRPSQLLPPHTLHAWWGLPLHQEVGSVCLPLEFQLTSDSLFKSDQHAWRVVLCDVMSKTGLPSAALQLLFPPRGSQ